MDQGAKSLIYTVATGAGYRDLARLQLESLRQWGFRGAWRVITDRPGVFPEGQAFSSGDPSPGRDGRTVNRALKTLLPEFMELGEFDRVTFLEADVIASRDLSPVFAEWSEHCITVAPCWKTLGFFGRVNRGRVLPEVPAPLPAMVSVPRRFVPEFFAAWRKAHDVPALGFDELALYAALEGIPWGYSKQILRPMDGKTPLVHHNGMAKAEVSGVYREILRADQKRFINAPLSVLIGKSYETA